MNGTTLSMRGLAAMAQLLSRTRDSREVLEVAAETARAAMGAASVSIGTLDVESDAVRTIVNVGELGPDEVRWPDDEVYPVAGDARLTSTLRDLHSWTDHIDDPDCDPSARTALQRLGKGSSLVTPIVVDGEAWGEFFATRHIGDQPFDAETVAYAEVVVAILGAAVSRTLREAALEDLAFHDSLTGLLNRRGLERRVVELLDLGDAPTRRVVVVAVDIDGLKRVNDTLGHLIGDEQICEVARALLAGFAGFSSSVVARVGGDEFTVVVAGTKPGVVEGAINEICHQVAQHDCTIGLSAGIASATLGPMSAVASAQLFAAADEALYIAKRSDSTGVVVADDLSA